MEVNRVSCPICRKTFRMKKSLYAHIRQIHKVQLLLLQKDKKFKCGICDTRMSSKHSLSRHAAKFHKEISDHNYIIPESKRKSRLICPYENCQEDFLRYGTLRTHLRDHHQVELEMEELSFGSVEEFQEWKRVIQQETMSLYITNTSGKKLANGSKKQHYDCHRSYQYRGVGNNSRAMKSLGSNKIDKACPARMEVTINEGDGSGSVFIKFWKTHCGHVLQAERINLDYYIREEIAGKLAEGYSFDQILDAVRDSPLAKLNPRLGLLKRKDLHNIVRDFKITML